MPTPTAESEVLESLRAAIADAQGTIHAYDGKSAALGVALTFVIGVLQWVAGGSLFSVVRVVGSIGVMAGVYTAWQIGRVLWPQSKGKRDVHTGGYVPAETFYLAGPGLKTATAKSVAEKARSVDWVAELSFELIKLAHLRENKRDRFNRALSGAGVTFLIAVICVLIKVWCGHDLGGH